LNRTKLIAEVSKYTGLTAKQAESGLKAFEYVIISALRGNDTVRITGFGTFKVRDRAARRGRNPQTGAPVRIKASKGIGFAAGAGLKKDLNSRTALEKPEYLGTSPARGRAFSAGKVALAQKNAPVKKGSATAKKAPAKTAAAKKTPATAKKAPASKASAKKSTNSTGPRARY
jgi:DNA-binding protein HU-beta